MPRKKHSGQRRRAVCIKTKRASTGHARQNQSQLLDDYAKRKKTPRTPLSLKTTNEVIRHLFVRSKTSPRKSFIYHNCGINTNRAGGPAGVPSEIVKCVVGPNLKHTLASYNSLALSGEFLKHWKQANLVLIRKEHKPKCSRQTTVNTILQVIGARKK